MKHLKSGNAKNLKLLITACAAAVAIIATAGCHGRDGGSMDPRDSRNAAEGSISMQNEKQATVSGTVYYLQRIALPPGASVEVKLVDISRQDVPAVTIAEQKISNPGQVPIPFELSYDPAKIDHRMTYAVQARIERGVRLLFISTSVFPVITRGNPTHVEVKVDPVK